MGIYLNQDELKQLQSLKSEQSKMLASIGDLEMRKMNLMAQINEISMELNKKENDLIEKYGEGCTLNMSTGEVVQKDLSSPSMKLNK